ncbi:MAG: hypothetical protein JJ974_01705 [Phycisphaerales bacterium]|nr:hypothetical protein [Phycisphaerales bacterium]
MTTLNDPSWTPATRPKQGSNILRTLQDSMKRVRRRIIGRGILRWMGSVVGVLAVFVLMDLFLHINMTGRWMMLVILLGFAAWTFRRFVSRTLAVHAQPSDLALNLTSPGATTTTTSNTQTTASIAAIVDLPAPPPEERIEQQLREAIQRRSSRHIDSAAASATLRPQPLYEMLVVVSAICLVLILTVRSPMLATIGARRVLMPWTQVQWPKRFGITIPEHARFHPLDRAYTATALIGPSSDDPNAQLRWKLVRPDNTDIVRWTTLQLNKQGIRKLSTNRSVPTGMGSDPITAENQRHHRYEQLIPIQSLSAKLIPEGSTLQYKIITRDDESPTQRVRIVHPPMLESLTAQIIMPTYAQDLGPITARFSQGEVEIDPAARAIGLVLAGSSVVLAWEFSSPVRQADSNSSLSHTLKRTLVIDSTMTTSVRPVDENGLTPRDSVDVYIRVVADSPPESLISAPSTDLVIGQRALIDLSSQISDDLGIESTSLIASVLSADEAVVLSSQSMSADDTKPTRLTSSASLDLDQNLHNLDTTPGTEIMIRSMARDIAGLESQSPPRILRIVEDQDILRRVESQLGTMSEVLRKLDDQQRDLIARVRALESVDPEEQSQLTDQIQSRLNSAQRLAERLEQSRIQDSQLTPMLESLQSTLERAESSSQDATESLQREQEDAAAESMEETRDELADAIAMLDRGQDTWLATRAIEELRSKVESLLQDTRSLGEQTQGQSIDQLAEDDRSMLEKILERQRRVTKDARETIDSLDQQADALDENNPTGAQGIRDAATQGRNSGIEEQLNQAGDQIAQNQTSSAAATQEQVLEELDNMLEQIEQAERNRDSALRRKLASLIESISTLIEDQELEITRLDANLANLDRSMIALRDNTLAIRDEASAAFPETRIIAESLTSATESQAQAIGALRARPADLNTARQSELAAISHLQSALEEARKQDQAAADRQAQQLREQLREQYQDALDEQIRITTETKPMIGENLSRRQRAQSRKLATQERDLQSTLDQMLAETEELSEAPIFTLAHDQIALLLETIAEDLNERSLNPSVVLDQQSVATILSALVEVLGNAQQPSDDQLEDGQNSSGGGQGSGGADQPVIPPVAQLQLLRTLQQLTATQTRAMSESGSNDPDRLRSISTLQQELAQKGQELIEQMNQTPQMDEPSPEEQSGSE